MTDLLPVRLVIDAGVTINMRGQIIATDIHAAQLGIRVALDEKMNPIMPKMETERLARRIVDNEYPIIRQMLHAAALSAMPKGDEQEIIAQHIEEKTQPDVPCGAVISLANGEHVSPCHLASGHEGNHEGWCLGSRATWAQGQTSDIN